MPSRTSRSSIVLALCARSLTHAATAHAEGGGPVTLPASSLTVPLPDDGLAWHLVPGAGDTLEAARPGATALSIAVTVRRDSDCAALVVTAMQQPGAQLLAAPLFGGLGWSRTLVAREQGGLAAAYACADAGGAAVTAVIAHRGSLAALEPTTALPLLEAVRTAARTPAGATPAALMAFPVAPAAASAPNASAALAAPSAPAAVPADPPREFHGLELQAQLGFATASVSGFMGAGTRLRAGYRTGALSLGGTLGIDGLFEGSGAFRTAVGPYAALHIGALAGAAWFDPTLSLGVEYQLLAASARGFSILIHQVAVPIAASVHFWLMPSVSLAPYFEIAPTFTASCGVFGNGVAAPCNGTPPPYAALSTGLNASFYLPR